MRRPTPKRPPVNVARNLIQGGSGGIIAGMLIGLIEAGYHLGTGGAPDVVSPLYATVLYGLIGLGFGVGGGVALSVWERVGTQVGEEFAWAWGHAVAAAPMLLFILHYLANKVVYLERGVPMQGKLTVLAIGLGIPALVLLLYPFLLAGPLKGLLKAKGLVIAWGGAILVTGVVSQLPLVEDPRAGWAQGQSVPPQLADGPDVLLVMVDTLRADHLGAYGAEGDPTPNLDALADDGVVFEQAYAQASWTRSSGASLFTSRLPSGHNADTKASRLPDEVVTFAEPLQALGVSTGALINNINMTSTFGFDQGFDVFYYEAPAYAFWGTESVFELTMYKVVHKLAERLLPGKKTVEEYYQPADVVLADAQRFIESNDQGRWALFVHLMEPHDPYFEHPYLMDGEGDAAFNGVGFARAEVEHPDPSQADYLRQVYADEVRHLDREVGPFLDWLRETGRYDDTLIVFTSDHGEEFYEHGGWWHGTTLYEEQIHVPLVVKLPGNEHAGFRAPWQVRSIDIAPTLTAALGVEPDASWQGADLVPEVAAEFEAQQAPPAPADEFALEGEPITQEPARGHRLDRTVVAEEDFEGNVLGALLEGGFKYVRANEGNPRGLPTEELFDLQGDPEEQVNLVGSSEAIDGAYPADIASSLSDDLRAAIRQASAGAAESGTAEMSANECERLKALGYLAGDEDCG